MSYISRPIKRLHGGQQLKCKKKQDVKTNFNELLKRYRQIKVTLSDSEPRLKRYKIGLLYQRL